MNGLDEFEAIVEAGSNGLNLFLSSKVGLFLGDGLYSCTKGLNAHTIREVPILDVIVMNFNQVELFWSVGETFGCDLVLPNIDDAFTSFEDVAGLDRVRIVTM